MRKIVAAILLCGLALTANAVPARRGWQTRTQADGTTIEVQVIGDEFYHYTINKEGKHVRLVDGMYVEVGEAPTQAEIKARRAKAVARRQRKDVGTTPNLAPRGIVILVNFSDKAMQNGHTQATFDELCNSANCTVNSGYPSAAQYFADQSNGSYRPIFDVYGPVTLSKGYTYYGENVDPEDEDSDDKYATDAVIEACIKLNSTVDFTQYDSDHDGYVDFVYVIYAGKGAADGGGMNTIWPHNYSVQEVIKYKGQGTYSTYSKSDTRLDGVYLDNYAMSQEISGNSLAGIGTLCHEFGHVIGLPDLYDTSYGSVYNNSLSPNDWNIMDGGSYNADGHCPPNYDPWEKEFFGWITTTNLGTEGQNLTLKANGTEGYQAYQINASGQYVSPTTTGPRYYIENRQAQGWDAPLTGHGMLIWKVNFKETAWVNNAPNNSSTSGAPLYSVVSAYGNAIGWDGETDNCPWNTFPGTKKKTSWNGVSGKPLLNIAESNGIVTLTYIEEPQPTVEPFDVKWYSNGELFKTNQCTEYGKVVLPTDEPTSCEEGKVFVGWTATASYSSETKAPTYVKAGDDVTEGAAFYAVFATQEGEGGAAAFDGNTGGTFKIYANAKGTKYYATATVNNSKLQSTTNEAEAAEFTLEKVNGGFTIKTGGKYLSNGSKTNVSLVTSAYTWSIENGTQGTWRVNSSTNTGRAFSFRAGNYNYFGAYSTNNLDGNEYFDLEIGSEGGAIYSNYTTTLNCGTTGLVQNAVKTVAKKAIRDGQLVIIRGAEVYSVTGARLQ